MAQHRILRQAGIEFSIRLDANDLSQPNLLVATHQQSPVTFREHTNHRVARNCVGVIPVAERKARVKAL
jgi:hypothetical protein